jgi:hypothetical protein
LKTRSGTGQPLVGKRGFGGQHVQGKDIVLVEMAQFAGVDQQGTHNPVGAEQHPDPQAGAILRSRMAWATSKSCGEAKSSIGMPSRF